MLNQRQRKNMRNNRSSKAEEKNIFENVPNEIISPSYSKNIESPKEKNLYFWSTA
jgi:hypothetical protein